MRKLNEKLVSDKNGQMGFRLKFISDSNLSHKFPGLDKSPSFNNYEFVKHDVLY